MNTIDKFTNTVIDIMRVTILDAQGNEVLFLGKIDEDGIISLIEVGARGDENSVPAIFPHMMKGDVVIHNHPSGGLKPSSPDLNVASMLGNDGIGFYIIDNDVEKVYVVVEPIILKDRELLDDLTNILEPDGPLSKLDVNYEYRESQSRLLNDITYALNHDCVLAAEAGTGVGKSFAYLIPAIKWAEVNKDRIVISTGTINLQQQLVEKDIPLAKKILGSNLKTVLVKGRGNYLCHKRLYSALEDDSLFRDEDHQLNQIKEWTKVTKTGSLSDLTFMPERDIWNSINSDAETCTGIKCSHFNKCFSMKARKEASTAGIIVVNHHLLFADLAMRLDGAGFEGSAVLPPFYKIIFDEAHNIEDSATSFFSERYNKYSLIKYLNRLLGKKMGKRYGSLVKLDKYIDEAAKLSDVVPIIDEIKDKADTLDQLCLDFTGGSSLHIEGEPKDSLIFGILNPALNLQKSILSLTSELATALKSVDEEFHDLDAYIETARLKSRLESYATFFEKFRSYIDYNDEIFWVDKSKTSKGDFFVNYSITPIDISKLMNKAVFEPYSSVICTSATLTVNNNFKFWKNRVGLQYVVEDRFIERVYDSPFEYHKRVFLGVPTDIPLPNENGYLEYLQDYIKKIVTITNGSALILFTSYMLLKEVYDSLKLFFEGLGVTVYRQGDDDRSRLLNSFKTDISSVLFATESFWEGVDSPGETLKVVIITKLPFRVPTDPIIKARMDRCKQRNGNPFMELSIPDAVTRLKQGFGRLMRRKSDWGMVFILDSRCVKKQYGPIFLNSLPQCRFVADNGNSTLEYSELFFEEGEHFE
ncbi:DEAD/DEAH box helicase [Thiospirochaeta perfilievii]|uniref:DEAD/DEAH box helicase n=1 Tax=Thiospirochaeta perfilievii TaxID=252967 RepID=A0A5C1Q768_9SPIO|nr:helicase C-terminal domain-containing protein [Thiospirochaeta perfilievii]QEN03217.1 DEAD/DEAH box helicase [Thiospirochaeta perfilievii]